MPRVEYLLIFNALLFGIGSSLYFLSFARIIQENRVRQEWRWFAVALPFFLMGLAMWFVDYGYLESIDDNFWSFIASFVSTGFLFVIAAILNPEGSKVGWGYLRSRVDEVLIVFTIGYFWDVGYHTLWMGIEQPVWVYPMLAFLLAGTTMYRIKDNVFWRVFTMVVVYSQLILILMKM